MSLSGHGWCSRGRDMGGAVGDGTGSQLSGVKCLYAVYCEYLT